MVADSLVARCLLTRFRGHTSLTLHCFLCVRESERERKGEGEREGKKERRGETCVESECFLCVFASMPQIKI